jgi:DNA-binding NarL/FixJ family response regulator
VIGVLVISGVRLYRDVIGAALARDARIEVVGTASNAAEAIACACEREPDAAVLDLGVAGPSVVRELTAAAPKLRVVALAVQEVDADVVGWAEAGIAGFVTPDGTVADLVAAVVAAVHDELVCSPRMAAALLRRVRATAGASVGAESALTPREIEIARLLERGLTNKEIASRLCVELPTVKNHVHRILEKLGVGRRTEAAARIRRAGLALRD